MRTAPVIFALVAIGAGAMLGTPAQAAGTSATSVTARVQAPGDPAPDFDGDGYGDLVVGSAHDSCRRRSAGVECGSVSVFYGGADGPVLSRTQSWDQGSDGVPGTRDAYDLFGFSTASGDLDADGFDDLAIGIAFDRTDDAGSVVVLYGSATGLSGDRAQLWSPRSPGVIGVSRFGDLFGRSVAIGDVDGDSYPDLAVGSWSYQTHRAAVHVLYGSPVGITADGNERRKASEGGHSAGDWYGWAVAVADFDADGFGDVAVGIARAKVDGEAGAGAVEIIAGSAAGMDPTTARTVSQATPGILGEPAPADAMGADLDAADFDGDGFADLAVGTPGDGDDDAGAVNVLYGSAAGLAVDGNQLWTSPGADVAYGALTSAWAGDIDGDGLAELVITAPGRYGAGYEDAGVVGLLRGSSEGLTDVGGTVWTGEPGDYFGSAATAVDLDADGFSELSVGAPQADVATASGHIQTRAGMALVYAGAEDGPATGDPLVLTQATEGVPGPMRRNDRFGEYAP